MEIQFSRYAFLIGAYYSPTGESKEQAAQFLSGIHL